MTQPPQDGPPPGSPSPWAQRFGELSDEVLRRRLRVPAERLFGLNLVSPEVAVDRICTALKSVVTPTEQMLRILRTLLDRARAYCLRSYPDAAAVLRLMYGSKVPAADDGVVTCLTGLSGAGKSVLLDLLCRLLSERPVIDIAGHASLELRSLWRLKVLDRATFAQMVTPQFRHPDTISPPRVLAHAVTEAAAQGVATILADEFQFITGSDANTHLTKILLRLSQVGPPLVFACNYSMVHALLRRPQQDRDRLLAAPIVLLPEPVGADWFQTVADSLEVAAEFQLLQGPDTAVLLHRYTFANKRSLRRLLCLSYLEMRRDKETQVSVDHLRRAYMSVEYTSTRRDVEQLTQNALDPQKLPLNLRCPFESAECTPSAKPIVPHPAAEQHEERQVQAALRSQLTPEARRMLALLENQGDEAPPASPKSNGSPLTAANLIGGAQLFLDQNRIKPRR